jgi:hypothetical protein
MKKQNEKIITLFLTFIIYLSFFFGFYIGENSIGSGGYDGDLSWMWGNFELFKTNSLIEAINHKEFYGNRTPLLYLLHYLFNPFINDIDLYRITVFCISLIAPIIFYLCLKQRFNNTNNLILFFLSSLILLSPYFRTSSYWGLEINYGIISMLSTIYFLNNLFTKITSNNFYKYKDLFFVTLFSSLCIYFDQKLLLIPLISVIIIILSNLNIKLKAFTIICYTIFAIPFLYLIYIWNGIVPTATQITNYGSVTNISRVNLHYNNIGYATTIIAFYLLPLAFLKKDNLLNIFRNFFNKKINIYKVSIFFIFLAYLLLFNNFETFTVEKQHKDIHGMYGLGFVHKIALLLFDSYFYQKIFTYFAFFVSWIILLACMENKLINFLIVIYFYFISLLLFPIVQEYFDPYIIILGLLIFKANFELNFKKAIYIFTYLLVFLLSTNIYYFYKLTT